jgi:hypothetical protein
MEEPSRTLGDSERPFPGVLRLIHETIAAAFAEEETILFVDLLLQLFWICILHLIDQSLELMVHLFLGFQKNTIKVGKDPDMGHVDQTPRGEFLSTTPAFTFFHGFIFLSLTGDQKKSLGY